MSNRDSVPLGTLQETVEHTSEWLHQGPRSWCLNTLIGWVLLSRGNIAAPNGKYFEHHSSYPLQPHPPHIPSTVCSRDWLDKRDWRAMFLGDLPIPETRSLPPPVPICYFSGFPWPNRRKSKHLHQPDLDHLLQLSSSSSLHQPSLPHLIPRQLCIHKHRLPSLPPHPKSIFLHCSVSWKPAEVLSTQFQWPAKPSSWKNPVLGSKGLISWSDPNALWAALGQGLGLMVSVCGPHSI